MKKIEFNDTKKYYKWLGIFIAIAAVGIVIAAINTPQPTPEQLAAKKAEAEQIETKKQAEIDSVAKAKEQKALADQVADTLFDIKVSSKVECEAAVKAKLDLPHTADFDMISVRFGFDSKAGLYELYNKFDYKNRFNAPLRAAYLCKVDAKGFKKGADVKVVSVKLGRE
jgi:hypothetical protein